MADLLLEMGCEEIPARMIDGGREELARRVTELLVSQRLIETASISSYSTPRRIAVLVKDVLLKQTDMQEQILGPSRKVAYKDGQPTAAAHAFAKKNGIDVAHLTTVETPKGEYLGAVISRKGRPTGELLTELLPGVLAAIPWPKSMYWRSKNERFVRPVHWIVAILNDQLIPFTFAGIAAGKSSRGHRMMGHEAVTIASPSLYVELLTAAKVLPDPAVRNHRIRKALDAATRTVAQARWREDDSLLATVVNLTEYPSVVLGRFDPEFLQLPEEILVTVMRDHQKYFAVEEERGRLAPYFLAVLNTDGDPEHIITHGHQRVLRARFNDARFFWDTDQKLPMPARVDLLRSIVFHNNLGSYHEKTERIMKLTGLLSAKLSSANIAVDSAALQEAATLAKADLTTELVKEFTELQGVVGGLYSAAQGKSALTSQAIYDHYRPVSIEDASPRSVEGALLSIADKADSIAGMFSLGLQPTGSRDPLALRRQANGIVKTIADHQLPLSLEELFTMASALHPRASAAAESAAKKSSDPDPLQIFLRERVEFYLREAQEFAYDVINAAMAADWRNVVDLIARCKALTEMRGSEDFKAIATSFKRIKNILRQAAEANKPPAQILTSSHLVAMQEKDLATALAPIAEKARLLGEEGNYLAALTAVSTLRPAVDAFFDHVMVMVDDPELRSQRLALLAQLLKDFSSIADFSEIVLV